MNLLLVLLLGLNAQITCLTEVRFSPQGGAEAMLVQAIDNAQHTLIGAIYSLTSDEVVRALIWARVREVDVRLKVDKLQSQGTTQSRLLKQLKQDGVPVQVSKFNRTMHNKFIVVDSNWVLTGSFNWTTNAEYRNEENLVALQCPELAKLYETRWQQIQ